MCDDHSNALANFPSSLEEALDFAIEVPFPHFESTVNIQDGFDISHDPPVPSLVEGDREDSISETSDSILNPPPSFFCIGGSSEEVHSSGSGGFSLTGSDKGESRSPSPDSCVSVMGQNSCSTSSQTPQFPFYQSFDWFKQKYPELLYPSVFNPPILSGRAFSVSQLDQIDDQILQNYRDVNASCTPIPAGFWAEMGRVDSAMNSHFKTLEEFLPNEEWVHRRICESGPLMTILKRYLGNF